MLESTSDACLGIECCDWDCDSDCNSDWQEKQELQESGDKAGKQLFWARLKRI